MPNYHSNRQYVPAYRRTAAEQLQLLALIVLTSLSQSIIYVHLKGGDKSGP